MTAVAFDDLLTTRVGAFGPWQWGLFLLVTIATNSPVLQFPQLATLAPPHRCALEESDAWHYNVTLALCRELRLHHSAHCAACEAPTDNGSALRPCPRGWRYSEEDAPFRKSITQEFDLVCGRRILVPLSSMLFMAGMSVGYVTGGFLGDRFGRRNVSLVAGLASSLVGLLIAFSVNIWMFTALRFVLGSSFSVCILNSHVYCNEITDTRHRNTYSFLFHFNNDVVMNLYAVLTAYFLQDWRIYHAVLSVPTLLCVLFFCFVPESPRWLLSAGREEEAQKILARAAVRNGRRLTHEDFLVLEDLHKKKKKEVGEKAKRNANWRLLFTNKRLLPSTVVLSVAWFGLSVNYFGLWFFAVRSKGNPYIIAFVGCLLGFPVSFLKLLLFHFFDRKRPLCGAFIIGCLLCIGAIFFTIFAPHHIANTILATVAIGAAAASYIMIFNVSPEQFPTELRGVAMGFLMMISRLGATLGMLVERLDELLFPVAPMTVFTTAFAGAAVATAFLPNSVMASEMAVKREEKVTPCSD